MSRHARIGSRTPTRSPTPRAGPLRLLTAPSYFQPHTTFSGVEFLRHREGEPYCVLHPEDAARRGLVDGQKLKLFNQRGTIRLMLRVADEILPGVILVPVNAPCQRPSTAPSTCSVPTG